MMTGSRNNNGLPVFVEKVLTAAKRLSAPWVLPGSSSPPQTLFVHHRRGAYYWVTDTDGTKKKVHFKEILRLYKKVQSAS